MERFPERRREDFGDDHRVVIRPLLEPPRGDAFGHIFRLVRSGVVEGATDRREDGHSSYPFAE